MKSQGLTLGGFEISELVHHRTWSLFVGRLGTLLPHIGLELIIAEWLAWQLLGVIHLDRVDIDNDMLAE